MKKKTIIILVSIVSSLLVLSAGAGMIYAKIIYNINHPDTPVVNNNKRHIACVGDSLTFGAGTPLTYKTESYPAYLNQYMGKEYQVLNYGFSGRTLLKEGNHPYINEEFYTLSKEVNAETYIIMLGTNDSKEINYKYVRENNNLFKEELLEFVSSYKNLESNPTIYLMQPPKVINETANGGGEKAFNDSLIHNEIANDTREVSEELGVYLINLYDFTKDHKEWYIDGVHFTATGNKQIAKYIYDNMIK